MVTQSTQACMLRFNHALCDEQRHVGTEEIYKYVHVTSLAKPEKP